jgi:AhpD family alkylhydroperoxidase
MPNPFKYAGPSFKALMAFEESFAATTLEPNLAELVRLRASQINQCAYCIHLHVTELHKLNEDEMRLHLLAGWRESPLYTPRERAALAWTEALTRVSKTHAPDADFEILKGEFTEEEQVQLTLLIGAINVWNRLQIGFRAVHPTGHARTAA